MQVEQQASSQEKISAAVSLTCSTIPITAHLKNTSAIPLKKQRFPRTCFRLKKNTNVRRTPIVIVMPAKNSTSPVAHRTSMIANARMAARKEVIVVSWLKAVRAGGRQSWREVLLFFMVKMQHSSSAHLSTGTLSLSPRW